MKTITLDSYAFLPTVWLTMKHSFGPLAPSLGLWMPVPFEHRHRNLSHEYTTSIEAPFIRQI